MWQEKRSCGTPLLGGSGSYKYAHRLGEISCGKSSSSDADLERSPLWWMFAHHTDVNLLTFAKNNPVPAPTARPYRCTLILPKDASPRVSELYTLFSKSNTSESLSDPNFFYHYVYASGKQPSSLVYPLQMSTFSLIMDLSEDILSSFFEAFLFGALPVVVDNHNWTSYSARFYEPPPVILVPHWRAAFNKVLPELYTYPSKLLQMQQKGQLWVNEYYNCIKSDMRYLLKLIDDPYHPLPSLYPLNHSASRT